MVVEEGLGRRFDPATWAPHTSDAIERHHKGSLIQRHTLAIRVGMDLCVARAAGDASGVRDDSLDHCNRLTDPNLQSARSRCHLSRSTFASLGTAPS